MELAKEKITSNRHKNKVLILPYSYIHRNSKENLNLVTNLCIAPLSKNKRGIAIANF